MKMQRVYKLEKHVGSQCQPTGNATPLGGGQVGGDTSWGEGTSEAPFLFLNFN